MVREELLGAAEIVCLQCGRRVDLPSPPVYQIRRRRFPSAQNRAA